MTLTVLSAAFGYVCFQVDFGLECLTFVGDLRDAKVSLMRGESRTGKVRVDGQLLDESDVDLLLDVATRRERADRGPVRRPRRVRAGRTVSGPSAVRERDVMKQGLVFYPASHRYRLDGQWVPGVTSILGVLNKPAIPKWAATQVAEFVADHPDGVDELRAMGRNPMVYALKELPWSRRDEAAVKGSEIHDFAERIVNGESVEVPNALTGYVESAVQFMEDYGIRPVLVEAVVGSREHRYAGKLDLVADSDRHPRSVYDWKTAKSGIYGQTAWQNVAYALAEFSSENGDEQPMADVGIEASFGVHLQEDGYDCHPLAFGPHIFDEFLAIRSAYDANKRAVGDWRIPGTGYVGISEQSEAS